MHGQGQKREQIPKTKIFVGFHNHFPLLTIARQDQAGSYMLVTELNYELLL